jgi:hypothetical protein
MLITISENAKLDDVGFRPVSSVSSGDIAGWGTEESRTSYKRDLAELGNHGSAEVYTKQRRKITKRLNQATPCKEVSEEWGFYDTA